MSLERYLNHSDRGVAVEAAIGAAIHRVAGRTLRRRLPPSLRDMAHAAAQVHGSARELLSTMPDADERFTDTSLLALTAEYDELHAELARRYEAGSLRFPQRWAVEDGTSFLLYALVRAQRPSVLVELGVANGHSTYYMLKALARNGHGTLHSFDLEETVGSLLTDADRGPWEFRRVTRRTGPGSLTAHLADMPLADLAFHDADHGYLAQVAEFPQLWNKLSPIGTLVLDDVDASYALIDWCRQGGAPVHLLLDRRKAVAVLTHP